MPRFLIPQKANVGEVVALPLQETRHLTAVFRETVGDRVHLSDGKGSRYLAEIKALHKKGAALLILSQESDILQKGTLRIGQALLKGDKMEFVLQKAVELGVASFHSFTSSRTIVRRPNTGRWRKIADEALKQCGRSTSMVVEEPLPFEELVRKIDAEKKILFWEEGGRPFRDLIGRETIPTKVAILIGPEGGFSGEEVLSANSAGFEAVSLGPLTLRAETAAIVAMGLIQYEWGNISKT